MKAKYFSLHLRLKRSLGGCGVPATVDERLEAYEASRYEALKKLKYHEAKVRGPKVPEQRAAAKKRHEAEAKRLAALSEAHKRHLEQCSMEHSSAWMNAVRDHIAPARFAAALRLRARAMSRLYPSQLRCPGCNYRATAQVEFVAHAHGCATLCEENAATKHNAGYAVLQQLAKTAGLSTEVEPREFQTYKCPQCREGGIANADRRAHSLKCGVSLSRLVRSGPDWSVLWPGGPVKYYDFTVIHAIAPSHVAETVDTMVAKVRTAKRAKYVDTGMIVKDDFEVMHVFSLGGLGPGVLNQLKHLAALNGVEESVAIARMSATLMERTGAAITRALVAAGRRCPDGGT
jgi:hypothetical protein